MDETKKSGSCFDCLKSTFCCSSGQDVNISAPEPRRKSSNKEKEVKKVIETAPKPDKSAVQIKKQEDVKTSAVLTSELPVKLNSEPANLAETDLKILPVEDGPPEWLDSAFVETTLQSKEPGIKVTSIKTEPAVALGENYSCIVHRVNITTSHGPLALIIKCIPKAELRAKLMKEPMIREIEMYKNTIPLLRGDNDKPNTPQYYLTTNDKLQNENLILNDMNILGYKLRNRKLGLDEIHCRLALTELAHHHANSIAQRINHPLTFETKILLKYPDVLYTEENREVIGAFINTTLSSMSDMVRNNFPYRFQIISESMDLIFKDRLYDVLHELNGVPESKEELEKSVVTLLHGDFWSNNLLFQYDDINKEKPQSCCLLDFQMSRCASPVIDLLYFFYTSTTQETRREHLDSLLQHYLAQVLGVLHKKGVNDPGTKFYSSLSQIKQDMKDKAIFGLVAACLILPIVVVDAADVPSFDDMKEEEFKNMTGNPFDHLTKNPLFRERFQGVLEDMDDMGVFKKKFPQVKHH